jgi:outer membrane receptor protein involved in Fe transport
VLRNLSRRRIAGGELQVGVSAIPNRLELTLGLALVGRIDGPELDDDHLVLTGGAATRLPVRGDLQLGARARNRVADVWGSYRLGGWTLTVSIGNLLADRRTDEDTAAYPGRAIDVAIPHPGTTGWASAEGRF